MQQQEETIRQSIIDACLQLHASGINQGTSGNISVRYGDYLLITPSGIAYEQLQPESITRLALQPGDDPEWHGPHKPSSEWPFHRDIMLARPEINAVVHLHPTFCAALAINRRSIPACHYMVAAFGGKDVHCADYALFGTAELSQNVLRALEERTACLMANHGMIAAGESLEKAVWRAVELEALARQYVHALQIGTPVLLSDAEMDAALQKFTGYGLQTVEEAGKYG